MDPREESLELVSSRHDDWLERFAAEHDRVAFVLADAGLADDLVRIEHVGSTAVPDLAAKDIVDLDVVVADNAVSEVSSAVEAALGGSKFENSDAWHPVFREDDGQRFNDHVFAASSERWKISVATREIFRERSDVREEYEQLKRRLANEHDTLADYSQGKTAFIEDVLRIASESKDVTLPFDAPDDW
ncbi:GrpB family protein [Halobacterium zhouii]|uniref:GrpB family protein n=1 Tax=Halobacterium zhouii TaxID=2902624 RepID=UPI001E4594AF|nr:GrpB family protein [Halobacterium zhouii]